MNTNLVLGTNWELDEWPDFIDVSHEGTCEIAKAYVPERTCEPEIEHKGDLIMTRYPCCGYELKEYKYSPYPEVAFNFCPHCGAKVVE